MIVTVTANPSLDRTLELSAPLAVGQVQTAPRSSQQPGGKGVNIARVLTAFGVDAHALLPGDLRDPVRTALDDLGIAHSGPALGQPIRSNVAVTDPAGETTKLNEAGPELPPAAQAELIARCRELGAQAETLVLAGSLPPGAGSDFWARIIGEVRAQVPDLPIAVDSSGPGLAAAVAAGADLIKPNSFELLELLGLLGLPDEGASGEELEDDPERAIRLALPLAERLDVLLTLGAAGAALLRQGAVWRLTGPAIRARSTVGAGDSTLSGYLIARRSGATPPEALRTAAACGRAAAMLPGSGLPTPADLDLTGLDIQVIDPTTLMERS